MMRVRWTLGLSIAAALLNAGCSISGGGGYLPVSTPAVPAAPPPAPPVSYGAFLEGPVGNKLSGSDRDKALKAEQDALASGQRRTWKGDHGVYGYVEPGPATTSSAVADGSAAPATEGAAAPGAGTCKSFTSTIYLSGRPQVGHGTGCQNPDGSFRIAG